MGSAGLSRKFAEAKERWRARRMSKEEVREEDREEAAGGFHLQEEVKGEDGGQQVKDEVP
jgi:hypothetical protein